MLSGTRSGAAPQRQARNRSSCFRGRGRGRRPRDAAAATPAAAASASAAPASDLRFLGKGPLCMPRLGLGLASLGRPGYINLGHGGDVLRGGSGPEQLRDNCWRVLDEAWAEGVRYFDAARSYGRAEEFLGGWLRERGVAPAEAVVGSKWGYTYTADWLVDTGGAPHEVKEHSAANLARQAEETAANLGSQLDLYQIHSATLESGVLANAEVLELLAQLKRERGWRLGLSVSGERQGDVIRQALRIRMDGGGDGGGGGGLLFDSVQATWNLLEQSAGPALLEARQAGLAVIVKEALANGRLTARNTDPAFAPRLSLLQDAANQYDVGIDALALAVAMAQPWRPMVLSGASNPEQLRSNCAAIELAAGELPREVADHLAAKVSQPAAEYWQQRAELTWN